MYRRVVSHARSPNARFVNRGSGARRLSLGQGKMGSPRSGDPVDRLPYEGNSEIDAPCYLRGKFFEAFGPEHACSPLLARRHQRRHSQMEPRVKSSRLIRDPEIAIELLELTAQSGELVRHCRGIADVVVRAKETIERSFDEPRFCGARTLGCGCQPRGHVFAKINDNSVFHSRDSLQTRIRKATTRDANE